jgi:D-glycero-D-manno-heptose 1,7-bisphosphate phosphatase
MVMNKEIKQAVILAGGRGLRLRALTQDTPKPMVLVNGRPFLGYLFELLKKNGIQEVVLLLGYLPEKIVSYVGDGSSFGLNVKYSIGTVEDGTGSRIRNAQELLNETFLLLYCDNFIHLDLGKLVEFHERHGTLATVTVYTNKHGITKNNVFVDESGYVTKYDKTRLDPTLNGVDLGFFLLRRELLKLMPKENFYLEEAILPKLIEIRQLRGFKTDQIYYSIGTPERLKSAELFLDPARKAVFLDRDGVVNKKMPPGEYIKKWSEFEFLPGVKEAMSMLTKSGFEIYIISNQAGIGRGIMQEGDLLEIHNNMEKELLANGSRISALYYCPHRAEDNCQCRKPKPGMLFQAALEHCIDLPRATFIGDDERDVEAGVAAGCRTELVGPSRNLLSVVKELIS